MILASITLGSIVFLMLITILYVQILHALKREEVTLMAVSFVVSSMILLKSIIPNVLLLFQLWSASKFTDSPNLTLAKEVALQFALIALFQVGIVVISSVAGYMIPTNKKEEWVIDPKALIVAIFMIAVTYLGIDLLSMIGTAVIGANEIGFH